MLAHQQSVSVQLSSNNTEHLKCTISTKLENFVTRWFCCIGTKIEIWKVPRKCISQSETC